MVGKLFSARMLPLAALILVTAGALLWAAVPRTSGSSNAAKSLIQWNKESSQELATEFHHIHMAWNEGKLDTVKQLIAGDDVLVTFELDGNQRAVPLRSKKEIDSFFDQIAKDASAQQGTYVLEMPKMNCRATASFGVCTEECTIHLKMDNGTERVDKSFGTAVAVKYEDGWKWIQYHMSVAGPSKTYKDGKLIKVEP
jgi:hypothetical protein